MHRLAFAGAAIGAFVTGVEAANSEYQDAAFAAYIAAVWVILCVALGWIVSGFMRDEDPNL